MTKQSIAFIGLGEMGRPMAKRLLDHGYGVTSCAHRRRENIEALKPDGLVEAADPAAASSAADTVITLLRDSAETEAAVLGDDGILAAMKTGAVLIIMSTVDPGLCKRIATSASLRDVAVIDAPVSGFHFRAVEGTLAIMAGGDEGVVESQRALLEVMGTIFPCGGTGMGQVAKLANNSVVLGTMALVTEAIAFAEDNGMAREALLQIFQNASADGFIVRNWEGLLPIWENICGLAIKDGDICLRAAADQGTDMPITRSMYEQTLETGLT